MRIPSTNVENRLSGSRNKRAFTGIIRASSFGTTAQLAIPNPWDGLCDGDKLFSNIQPRVFGYAMDDEIEVWSFVS